MPKIPTFISEARPTAEVSSIKSNIQVSPNSSLAAALIPAAKTIDNYYLKEKEISNKVESGKLLNEATLEIFELQSQSKLKSTPEEGINFFNTGYKNIVDKYKTKAPNNYISKSFEIGMASDKPSYVSSILKETRAGMVSTRVSQVDMKVKNKILNAVEGDNEFDFATLSQSIIQDYNGLVEDGIVGENDFNTLKADLPSLVETAMVNKIGRNNAYQAVLLLDDPNNFKQITGTQREELSKKLQTKALFQSKRIELANNSRINDSDKALIQELTGANNAPLGLDEEKLESFKTGDIEYDNQITELNDKVVKNEFSFNTNYNVNSDVIEKIANGEIKNVKEKFLLAGETEAKSILERSGSGTINLEDNSFLSTILTRTNNETFKKQDQQFMKYFDNLVPLLQGNTFLNYFDKEYNSKASELRQRLYMDFIKGTVEGIDVNDLLSPNSDSYIAKNIRNYLPKTSDLDSLVNQIVNENETTIVVPKKIEGETATEYLNRIENNNLETNDLSNEAASLNVNAEPKFANFKQNNNIKSINNYLIKRISPEASAAILGNMFAEGDKFNFNQEENTIKKEKGYGLFQFTDVADGKGHRTEYFKYLKNTNKKDSAESQIDYVLDNIYEGIGYDIGAGNRIKLQNIFKNEKNILKITKEFHDIFERPQPGSLGKRQNAAEKIYQLLTDTFPI